MYTRTHHSPGLFCQSPRNGPGTQRSFFVSDGDDAAAVHLVFAFRHLEFILRMSGFVLFYTADRTTERCEEGATEGNAIRRFYELRLLMTERRGAGVWCGSGGGYEGVAWVYLYERCWWAGGFDSTMFFVVRGRRWG